MRLVLAHGLGQSYDLPLPLWLYIYGGGAAVVLSFVPLVVWSGTTRDTARYPRFDLFRVGVLRKVLGSRVLLVGLQLLSVALFVLVVSAGFFGEQGGDNFAPGFVWAVWWVGFAGFVAFVGNLWPLVNPWSILFGWADRLARRMGRGDGLWLGVTYPESLGVWPAVALYLAFVWLENVYADPALPRNVALAALAYSLATLYGMALFGKEAWLRHGEAFSVLFGLLGLFAPTETRVKSGRGCGTCEGCVERCAPLARGERELNLRPFAVGLGLPGRPAPGAVAFVVLVLAGVTYDGLLETPLWVEVVRTTPLGQTSGLLLLWALFVGAYLGFVGLGAVLDGRGQSLRSSAASYALTLVPIAIAYQVAHYGTFLVVQAQETAADLSDPFGWGWDLFGTAGFRPEYGLLGAGFVWYAQVGLIVGGHVIAVYLAHGISRRTRGGRGGVTRGQIPMLVLMVLYTVSSLWILAQPAVE